MSPNAPVLDCSVVCAWLPDDENVPGIDSIPEQHVMMNGARAPALLWTEMRNALVMAERRGRLISERKNATVTELEDSGIKLDLLSYVEQPFGIMFGLSISNFGVRCTLSRIGRP